MGHLPSRWLTDIEARRFWERQYQLAHEFMASRRGDRSILIEIAAQHPLVDGVRPNEEFASRLDLGRRLYWEFSTEGRSVELYVPGSRHRDGDIVDSISLSAAGKAYLIDLDVPDEAIHGDDLNLKYKGRDGVYGSADECFVAASYFKDRSFGSLASVVSPAQLFRKTLHYLAFGVIPLNYTAPTTTGYHNYITEIFENIPHVLFANHDLQAPDSSSAQHLRDQRRP
jgi:hypothetical protein